jgi:DNA mismatch repair protein MutL
VQQVIYHAVFCHPQVTWRVEIDDRPWLALTPSTNLRTLLPQILPAVTSADLRETPHPTNCHGLIGLPDRCHRPRPDWIKLAINGRVVSLPEFELGLLQVFRHTLPRHRYPLCLIHLRLPPEQVDWHRSPDKSMVYLHRFDSWLDEAQGTITALLGPTPGPDSLPQGGKTTEAEGSYGGLESPSVDLSDPLPRSAPPACLTALAQVHQRYILAEQPDGLCLIEQHIAHERVIYERLQNHWQLVALPNPLVLQRLTTTQADHLQQLGLEVEAFGPQGWLVRTAPAPLIQRQDLAAALLELSGSSDLEKALVATACRTAIRNGTPLSLPEMQQLLQDWQATRHPRTCPHGRPICLTLTETTLARFFKRHWVIGKSHGI